MRFAQPATFAVAAVLSLSAAISACGQEKLPGLLKGNEYRQLGELARGFYVMGVVDGLQFEAANVKFQPDVVMLAGCVAGRTTRQLLAVVDKFLADRPEAWHKPMGPMIYQAILWACEEGK